MSNFQRLSISCGIVAMLVMAALLVMSTSNHDPTSSNSPIDAEPSKTVKSESTGDGFLSYDGISFSYDKSLDIEVEPGKIQPTPLTDESDKPDSVFPRHVLFRFKQKSKAKTFFEPELRVFPISAYKKQFSSSKVAATDFESRLDEITKLVAEKRSNVEAVPLLPYIDAEPAFISKLEFSSFRNGNGVWFVSQFITEPSTVSNFGLTYIYQGITRDKKYFVYLTFPVGLRWLPSDPSPFSTKLTDSNIDFKEYLKNTRTKIENAPSTDFQSNLSLLQKLISTLNVGPVETEN